MSELAHINWQPTDSKGQPIPPETLKRRAQLHARIERGVKAAGRGIGAGFAAGTVGVLSFLGGYEVYGENVTTHTKDDYEPAIFAPGPEHEDDPIAPNELVASIGLGALFAVTVTANVYALTGSEAALEERALEALRVPEY